MKEKDRYLKTFHLFSKPNEILFSYQMFCHSQYTSCDVRFCVCVFKPCAVLKCLYLIWLPFIPDCKQELHPPNLSSV